MAARLPITPYGKGALAACAAAVTAACGGVLAAGVLWTPWAMVALALPVAFWAWVLWFFRDPERAAPPGGGLFVSPADGRVADVSPVGADSPLGRPGVRVGVFMNVFNVHVNRSPCDGRVERIDHSPGAFLDVRRADAWERNESATIRLVHRHGGGEWRVLVRQVAGLIARRIVTDLSLGQELARGQRIGMIQFGSRLELWLPMELMGEIRVRVGQKVRAGETVLAVAKEMADGSHPRNG